MPQPNCGGGKLEVGGVHRRVPAVFRTAAFFLYIKKKKRERKAKRESDWKLKDYRKQTNASKFKKKKKVLSPPSKGPRVNPIDCKAVRLQCNSIFVEVFKTTKLTDIPGCRVRAARGTPACALLVLRLTVGQRDCACVCAHACDLGTTVPPPCRTMCCCRRLPAGGHTLSLSLLLSQRVPALSSANHRAARLSAIGALAASQAISGERAGEDWESHMDCERAALLKMCGAVQPVHQTYAHSSTFERAREVHALQLALPERDTRA